jgi:uncharacterized membrane protein YkgB
MQQLVLPADCKPVSKTHCVPSSVLWINRIALFLIFFWFGFLKLVAKSPAESLISSLHRETIASILSLDHFLLLLGFAECVIGLLWLFPQLTRFALWVFLLQMSLTFLPLVIIPQETWNSFLVLSLSGQYILKNVVLIACAFTLYKDCQVRAGRKSTC